MSNIRKFIVALSEPYQVLEDTVQTMLAQRSVDVATGWWLEQIGALVGQPRNGVTDDEVYRRYVRARVLVLKSDGQAETIYTIARLVLGDTGHTLRIYNWGVAAFVIRVETLALDFPTAVVLISFLRRAVSAGVRVILEFEQEDGAEMFAFDGGTGLGFGDASDPDVGGALASALE
jgi:hypothetical protein